MRYAIKSGAIEKVATDCLVVPVWGKSALTTEASHLDKVSGKALSTVIKSGDFSGKLGETSLLYKTPGVSARRILLVALSLELALLRWLRTFAFDSIFSSTASFRFVPMHCCNDACTVATRAKYIASITMH